MQTSSPTGMCRSTHRLGVAGAAEDKRRGALSPRQQVVDLMKVASPRVATQSDDSK